MRPDIISFDCYGTLVDWKTGIIHTLTEFLKDYPVEITGPELFELFIRFDAQTESGDYISYREILKQIMEMIGERLGLYISENELYILSESLPGWHLFEDTSKVLNLLRSRYKLAVISNVDNDLFRRTNEKLGVRFDYIITAENTRSYKPSLNNFRKAFELFGVSPEKHLHLAQSIYHDVLPAIELGLNCAWINRYDEDPGKCPVHENVSIFNSLEEIAAGL